MLMFGQRNNDVVTLKDGSVIKGEIIEQVPNETLKIRTRDGSVFVYQVSEISLIEKEEKKQSENGHKGLDLTVNTGYDIATKGGGGNLLAEVEVGKQFTKNFYWGLGSGVWFPTKGTKDLSVPITTGVKVFFPIENSTIKPYASLKGGYVVNTGNTDFNAILLQIMPGILFPLSKTIDMNIGAGYTHEIFDGGSGGAISVRMGINVHRSSAAIHEHKPLLPSPEKGFQFTVEGMANPTNFDSAGDGEYIEGGLNLVASYKLSRNLMVGIGAGYALYDLGESDDDDKNYDDGLEGSLVKGFLRGQYRFSDRRFSPFVACDLGMKYVIVDHGADFLKEDKSANFVSMFIAPGFGLSLRSSKNSYVDLLAGYNIGTPGKWTVDDNKYKSANMSSIFIKLGFTRTF